MGGIPNKELQNIELDKHLEEQSAHNQELLKKILRLSVGTEPKAANSTENIVLDVDYNKQLVDMKMRSQIEFEKHKGQFIPFLAKIAKISIALIFATVPFLAILWFIFALMENDHCLEITQRALSFVFYNMVIPSITFIIGYATRVFRERLTSL